MANVNPIVVFDAECLACSAWVQFLLKHDKSGQFHFASIQSAKGAELVRAQGLAVDRLDTLLLVDADRVLMHTDAVFEVLRRLGGVYRAAAIGKWVPAGLRDPLYRWVARNRYRVLGRRETCYMPSAEERSRFYE